MTHARPHVIVWLGIINYCKRTGKRTNGKQSSTTHQKHMEQNLQQLFCNHVIAVSSTDKKTDRSSVIRFQRNSERRRTGLSSCVISESPRIWVVPRRTTITAVQRQRPAEDHLRCRRQNPFSAQQDPTQPEYTVWTSSIRLWWGRSQWLRLAPSRRPRCPSTRPVSGNSIGQNEKRCVLSVDEQGKVDGMERWYII